MGSCFFKHTEQQQLLPSNNNPITTSSYNTEILIEDILNGNGKSLELLKDCLTARGWCKIVYPSSINIAIKETMNNINKWLNDTEINEKLKYSLKLNDGITPDPQSEYGYHRINGYKEGIRVLTGDIYKIHTINDKYPLKISNDILKINKIFDTLSLNLLKQIYKTIFNLNNYNEFGTKYDISLLNQNKNMKFSMLDFTKYFNDKQYIKNMRHDNDINKNNNFDDNSSLKPNVLKSNFNVFEHSDPGLFALSFCSTNDGLEMYDISTTKWIKIGLNEGIWWNGTTATKINNNFKSAKHRVMINDQNYKPRFTGWYEISCNKQLKSKQIIKNALKMKQTFNMDNTQQIKYESDDDNLPTNISFDYKRRIKYNEYNDGIPSGKRFILNQDL